MNCYSVTLLIAECWGFPGAAAVSQDTSWENLGVQRLLSLDGVIIDTCGFLLIAMVAKVPQTLTLVLFGQQLFSCRLSEHNTFDFGHNVFSWSVSNLTVGDVETLLFALIVSTVPSVRFILPHMQNVLMPLQDHH